MGRPLLFHKPSSFVDGLRDGLDVLGQRAYDDDLTANDDPTGAPFRQQLVPVLGVVPLGVSAIDRAQLFGRSPAGHN
jgi:hypothetical protein